MTNKEKFLNLVSEVNTETLSRLNDRIANRNWLDESQKIALMILMKLKELGWSQKDLATKMGVTPQYINQIVKGSENLTLSTIIKLQDILKLEILTNSTEKTLI